jgi:hypothetical protein
MRRRSNASRSQIGAGQRLTDDQIRAQNYFYRGIEAAIPG